MTGHPRILVVRFGALGDLVLTTPLLRALRGAVPGAAVTVVTKEAWTPLLAGSAEVAAVEPLASGEPLRALAARLRRTAWHARIDLHDSLRSAVLRRLLGGRWLRWRNPRWRRRARVWAGVRIGRIAPLAEQFCAAARPLGVVPDGLPPEIVPRAQDEATAAAVAPSGPFVVLVPGAAHATKRWPGAHWDRLASLLRSAGLSPAIAGTPAERALVRADGVVDACGIGLGPTAALLRRARVVVAGDTGLMHVATAVGTAVVALYGPTVTDLGYAPHGAARVLERDLPCRPCSLYGGRHCPMRHHRCMIEIRPEEVLEAVRERLG